MLIRGSCVLILIVVLRVSFMEAGLSRKCGCGWQTFPFGSPLRLLLKVKLESKSPHTHLSAVRKWVSSRGLQLYCTIIWGINSPHIHHLNIHEICMPAVQWIMPQMELRFPHFQILALNLFLFSLWGLFIRVLPAGFTKLSKLHKSFGFIGLMNTTCSWGGVWYLA